MTVSRVALAGGLFLLALAAAQNLGFAAEPEPKQARVMIDNFTFSPASVTVAPGTKVTWTNRDDIPHTVVDANEPRSVKSPVLDTGDTFEHTFTTAGTFRYFCSIHPHMQGTVIVQ